MAPHNEEDDPAIYRSSTHKKTKPPANGVALSSKISDHPSTNVAADHAVDVDGDEGEDESEPGPESSDAMEEDEEEDSTLLAVQPGFNRLLLVLRDERVMRFVKYVSAAAEGSRWDVCGEYEVGVLQKAEEGDSESVNGQ